MSAQEKLFKVTIFKSKELWSAKTSCRHSKVSCLVFLLLSDAE